MLDKTSYVCSDGCCSALAYLIGAGRGVQRRSVALVLVVAGLWALPFALRAWHGGLGSNMRYLLPLLPGLCALAAWARQRRSRVSRPLSMIQALNGLSAPPVCLR